MLVGDGDGSCDAAADEAYFGSCVAEEGKIVVVAGGGGGGGMHKKG